MTGRSPAPPANMRTAKPGVLVVTVEVDEKDADELDRWYREEHGPEKLAIPGYVGMRRFRALDGSARLLAIYELSDVEIAVQPSTASAESQERMRLIMEKWKDWQRCVWVAID